MDSNPNLVCKISKEIYGVKQASLGWYEKSHQTLIHFGFLSRKCDYSPFVYSYHNVTLDALVYVDEILITGSSSRPIHDLIKKIHSKYALKKLRVPQHFLGIEVHHQENSTLLLTQTK